MDHIFFDGWEGLRCTAIVGVLAYVTLVVFLRIPGNRLLSKMGAFDLVVTVALGPTLATILFGKDVTLAQDAQAFALLVAMQFVVTWSSVRAVGAQARHRRAAAAAVPRRVAARRAEEGARHRGGGAIGGARGRLSDARRDRGGGARN